MSNAKAAAGKRSAENKGIWVPMADDEPDEETLPAGVFREGDEIPEDRAELFHLDGRVYTAPKHLPPNLTFKFLKKLRTSGTDMATFFLMEQVIGSTVVDVLADHDELTEDELSQIMKVVQRHTMGVLEKSAGKS